MTLFEQLKPLVLGPWVRVLAIYIEIVTFALTLLGGWAILDITAFGVLGIIGITNIVLCVKRRKAEKVSRLLGTELNNRPSVGIISFDFVAGALMLISWGAYIWVGVARMSYNYEDSYSVFGAFVMVGDLAIAHIHIFMGAIATHALRQHKNGRAAARRAHSREQSKHGADAVVELAEPGQGPNPAQQV